MLYLACSYIYGQPARSRNTIDDADQVVRVTSNLTG